MPGLIRTKSPASRWMPAVLEPEHPGSAPAAGSTVGPRPPIKQSADVLGPHCCPLRPFVAQTGISNVVLPTATLDLYSFLSDEAFR